jgi:hypothetical protein
MSAAGHVEHSPHRLVHPSPYDHGVLDWFRRILQSRTGRIGISLVVAFIGVDLLDWIARLFFLRDLVHLWPSPAMTLLLSPLSRLGVLVVGLTLIALMSRPKSLAMRSADLRRRTYEVTSRLRQIQSACNAESNEILNRQHLESMQNTSRPEAVKRREWAEFSRELAEAGARLQSLFDSEHSRVVALRNQLIKRLGVNKDHNAAVNSLIDAGSVSGQDPLNEIANYLDQLSERLPGGR